MTHPRLARPDDAETLARIHVACWQETYRGVLPETEIARRDVAERLELWRRVLAAGQRVFYWPGEGFAQIAVQRERHLSNRYPAELWCLYVRARAHGTGLGRALLAAAAIDRAEPFTACVFVGNDRALAFYRKTGAHLIETRVDRVGAAPIREHILGWDGCGVAALGR